MYFSITSSAQETVKTTERDGQRFPGCLHTALSKLFSVLTTSLSSCSVFRLLYFSNTANSISQEVSSSISDYLNFVFVVFLKHGQKWSDTSVRGSHGLNARRAQRAKNRPEGPPTRSRGTTGP